MDDVEGYNAAISKITGSQWMELGQDHSSFHSHRYIDSSELLQTDDDEYKLQASIS